MSVRINKKNKVNDMDLLKQLIGESALQVINNYPDIGITLTSEIEFRNNLDVFTNDERKLYCPITTTFHYSGEYGFIDINLNNKQLGYIFWGAGYGLDLDILLHIQTLINKNIINIINKNTKSVYELEEVHTS